MTEWMKGNELEKRSAVGDLGGTMRLGAYKAALRRAPRSPRSTVRRISPSATATVTKSMSTTRIAWNHAGWSLSACRRTASCRKRWNTLTIRGSSASSTIRTEVPSARSASAVCELHRRSCRTEPAGLRRPPENGCERPGLSAGSFALNICDEFGRRSRPQKHHRDRITRLRRWRMRRPHDQAVRLRKDAHHRRILFAEALDDGIIFTSRQHSGPT